MLERLNPWNPITNPNELKHLGKLGEECGELSAAVSRCIIQGIEEAEPVTGKPNREWLEEEIADVIGNIELVCDKFNLNNLFIRFRADEKKIRLRTWHDMV